MNDLAVVMEKFAISLNSHPGVPRIIENFEKRIVVKVEDDPNCFCYDVLSPNNIIYSVQKNADEDSEVTMIGDKNLLLEIFSGNLSPAEAYMKGDLQCYASDDDHIILDSLSLVLWGI